MGDQILNDYIFRLPEQEVRDLLVVMCNNEPSVRALTRHWIKTIARDTQEWQRQWEQFAPVFGLSMNNNVSFNPTIIAGNAYSINGRTVPVSNGHPAPPPSLKRRAVEDRHAAPSPKRMAVGADRRQQPVPERRQQPAPERRQQPAPERRQHPAPERRQHPAPERRQQPAPERRQHPAPERRQHPAPELRQHPAPERRQHPAPERRQHPAPERAPERVPERRHVRAPVIPEVPVKRESIPNVKIKRESIPDVKTEPSAPRNVRIKTEPREPTPAAAPSPPRQRSVRIKTEPTEIPNSVSVCDMCEKRYREVANTDRSCRHHPGYLDLDDRSDEWMDWYHEDGDLPDTDEGRRQYPRGFEWTCCRRDGTGEACTVTRHVPRAAGVEPRRRPNAMILSRDPVGELARVRAVDWR